MMALSLDRADRTFIQKDGLYIVNTQTVSGMRKRQNKLHRCKRRQLAQKALDPTWDPGQVALFIRILPKTGTERA